MTSLASTGVSPEESKAFYDRFNNTLANLGNANSLINYADWGAVSSVSPLYWFKATQGEGGVRPPFVIKLLKLRDHLVYLLLRYLLMFAQMFFAALTPILERIIIEVNSSIRNLLF